jgi:hypothetical protein
MGIQKNELGMLLCIKMLLNHMIIANTNVSAA